MRYKFHAFSIIFALLTVYTFSQTPQSLDDAVRGCSRYLQGRFPKGTRAALVVVQGENREIGEYAHRKLGEVLVNSGWFTVVERNAAALKTIEREMDRHLNYMVSEETELSIGKQLGAEIIISGSLARSGQAWRLDVYAIKVESAERAAQWSADAIRPDPAWAVLASPRSASVIFDGDTLSARDKRTVMDGLCGAIQSRNIALDVVESAVANGYAFTVTVYREPVNTAGNALLKSEVIVALSRGGRVLCQTGTYHITETTEALTARRIADRLKDDKAFFNKVSDTVK